MEKNHNRYDSQNLGRAARNASFDDALVLSV